MAPDAPQPGGPLPRPWGVHALREEETVAVRLGARDLWLRPSDGEVRVAHRDRGSGSGDLATWGGGEPPPDPPDDSEWTRWATPGDQRSILLRPVLPDRPVVLETEWAFRLLPGARARVFVRVPLWIRIELLLEPRDSGEAASGVGGPIPDGPTVPLVELPTVVMSDTWWGELHQGELAYWLPTTARRAMAPGLFAPHVAACPLQMRNAAESDLAVERLALRVDHLSLFAEGGGIWGDESRVRYQGAEEGSRIDMSGRPPAEAEGALLVAGPRTPVQRGLRARTFERLKALPGLGGGA